MAAKRSKSTLSLTPLQELCSKLLSGGKLTQDERRGLARHPAWFARLYLKNDDGDPLVPAPHHWDWYDLFLAQLRGEIRHLAIMAPKDHAKSTIFSKVIPLYLTCVPEIPGAVAKHGPNVRIINGSVNSELAEQFFLANRNELERNELLIEDFGPFRPERTDGGKWTQSRVIVRRSSTSQSPTWRAVGTGKPVQGGRSDWVFADDISDLENSATQLQRDKVGNWFDGDLLGTLAPDEPVGAGGHALVIGTAKHRDDQMHRLEKKSKEPGSGWTFRRYDAVVDEANKVTLWPMRWSWDALMAKKTDVGSVTFNRDYRNVAVNDETALFKMELLGQAFRPELTFVDSYGDKEGETDVVTAGVDLAIIEDERDAQKSDGDYTVVTVWRRMPNGARRLIWGFRRRGLGMTPQITLTESTLRRYQALKIAIVEANQAQRWFASSLLTAAKGDLPIQKHVTGRGVRVDLYEGVPSLVALFEAGMVELPMGDEQSRAFVEILVNELHGFGVESHDDTVMSMWLNEVGIKKLNTGVSWGKVSTARK
jgi:phage terminase large subunit-like protein